MQRKLEAQKSAASYIKSPQNAYAYIFDPDPREFEDGQLNIQNQSLTSKMYNPNVYCLRFDNHFNHIIYFTKINMSSQTL